MEAGIEADEAGEVDLAPHNEDSRGDDDDDDDATHVEPLHQSLLH
jgi:hypothetical protein